MTGRKMGSVVYNARKQRGWDLFDLSQNTGIPYSILEHIELGGTPRPQNIRVLSEVLNIPHLDQVSPGKAWESDEEYVLPAMAEFAKLVNPSLTHSEVYLKAVKLRESFVEAMIDFRTTCCSTG